MDNKQKIQAILDSGKLALVEYQNGLFSIFLDSFGTIIVVTWKSIEGAKKYIGVHSTDSTTHCYENIKSITPLNYPPHKIKAGDKVTILECARELDWFNDLHLKAKNMIGEKEIEVKEIFGSRFWECCSIWDKDKTFWSSFPISCVCKVYEDETVEVD